MAWGLMLNPPRHKRPDPIIGAQESQIKYLFDFEVICCQYDGAAIENSSLSEILALYKISWKDFSSLPL
jgi:hypothetical protein